MYEPIQIGTTLWFFDSNRRVYPKASSRGSRPVGEQPIWREHWIKYTVIGETSRSWLVGFERRRPFKLPKRAFHNNGCPDGWARSEGAIERFKWVRDNRYRISEDVSRCKDHDTLQAIERLLQRHAS